RVEPVDDRIDPAQPSACLTICIDPPHSFAHGTFHSAPISADAARQFPPLDLPYQGVDASLFLLSPLLLFVTPNRLTSLAPGFLLLLALARPGAVGRLEDAAHDLGDHVLHAPGLPVGPTAEVRATGIACERQGERPAGEVVPLGDARGVRVLLLVGEFLGSWCVRLAPRELA